MQDTENEEIITIDDLCRALNIGPNAAYRLLNEGQIKAFRIGRVWKIPRLAVHEYIYKQSNLEIPNQVQKKW